jgi:hypothetical protein
MPNLTDAYLRIDRASEHLAELNSLCDSVCEAQAKATTINLKAEVIPPGESREVMSVVSGRTPIPDKCRLLVGDTANSFRSALDYLVGQLAELDSGSRQPKTQFPIESSPDGFNARKKTFLRGVNQAHITGIEALQPYNGCQWTEHLATLSNLDKHNELVAVAHDYIVTVSYGPTLRTEKNTVQTAMNVNIKPVLRIALGNGLPLKETLEKIKFKVTDTLGSFKLDFK